VTRYILGIAMNGADMWTLRKIGQNYLQILKIEFGAAEVWGRAIETFR